MANPILAGYMGILDHSGSKIRVSNFGVNPEQIPLYYDHTIGLLDTIPSSICQTKSPTSFKDTPQKNIYRPGVIGVNGSFSFPVHEGQLSFFEEAKTGKDFDITYYRDCENGRQFSYCKISQYQLNVSAGEPANTTVSVLALDATEIEGQTTYNDIKKIVTWDACDVQADGLDADILSFNMTITNDCKYIYTSGKNLERLLKPSKIRVGLQSVQGTITFYTKGMDLSFMDTESTGEKTISVTIGDAGGFDLNCVYVPLKREGQPGPIVSTLGFYGVGSYWL